MPLEGGDDVRDDLPSPWMRTICRKPASGLTEGTVVGPLCLLPYGSATVILSSRCVLNPIEGTVSHAKR